MSCGAPLGAATPADDARLSRLAAAAPAPLVEKVKAAAHLAGERRIVTALFLDVVGSTSLAEQMDAEDWTSIMNSAFDRFSPIVYRYEGTIARLLGDALLAFFGAPIAHEDDPVRAVHASLELLASATDYAQQVRRQHQIEFAVRIGLNTGPVVVGAVGSDLKYEYTAMGDAVNLAARMQSAARPMTTLISENCYRFVAPVFDCTDLGPVEVKGKSEPVRVYEVRGAKAQPGRTRGLSGLESPMVGRDKELTGLLKGSSKAIAGNGQIVSIIGEPGLGKSRLLSEWKTAVAAGGSAKPMVWAAGYCLSYGQGLAYHLLIDLVRAMIGVTSATSEAETRAALQSRLNDLMEADTSEVYPFLGHLLSVQLESEALERIQPLDPQALQAQYLSAIKSLLMSAAHKNPLGLILEDIHWADPSSTDLLVKLLAVVADSPILFCLISRPDAEAPGWKLVTAARDQFADRYTEVMLGALSDSESRLLVSNLLEIEALPEHIRNVILKKAEGNPFFVEEVIRMLIDRAAIIKEGDKWAAVKEIDNVEIPDNLQGLLLARIDRLPDDVKHTLRVASVIGRQFSVRVLEQVLGK
jgi:class 3 adenylate cyclase